MFGQVELHMARLSLEATLWCDPEHSIISTHAPYRLAQHGLASSPASTCFPATTAKAVRVLARLPLASIKCRLGVTVVRQGRWKTDK